LRGIDHLISSLPHEHPFVKYLPVAVWTENTFISHFVVFICFCCWYFFASFIFILCPLFLCFDGCYRSPYLFIIIVDIIFMAAYYYYHCCVLLVLVFRWMEQWSSKKNIGKIDC
jgi:hypothetical protein